MRLFPARLNMKAKAAWLALASVLFVVFLYVLISRLLIYHRLPPSSVTYLSVTMVTLIVSVEIIFILLLMTEGKNRRIQSALKEMSVLYETSRKLAATLEISELFYAVKDILSREVALDHFSWLMLDASGALKVQFSYGLSHVGEEMLLDVQTSLCGQVLRSQNALLVNPLEEGPFVYLPQENISFESLLLIPLIVSEQPLGLLVFGRKEADSFSPEDLFFFESLAGQIAVAFDRSQLYTKTKELSVTDELTSLYNRRYFQNVLHMELKRAIRFRRSLSLLMIDVDHFKTYNDRYGHMRGDLALKSIAAELVKNVRELDTVARFGGEEFIVLLTDTPYGDALKVGEKLRASIENSIEGHTVSIGVSSYPEHADTEEDLINTADIALYQAKTHGRNQVKGFVPHNIFLIKET